MNNPWNNLSSKFNIHKDDKEIDSGAADNILIAWPPIIDLINSFFKGKRIQNLKALDYGCGTGGFTHKLKLMGFDVVGMDSSEGMLNVARQSVKDVSFVNTDQITKLSKFNLITGIMVFQFIHNIDGIFKQLVSSLNQDGLIVFAVFNPKFVTACLKAKTLFSDFDSDINPQIGVIHFGKEISVPTYIRNAEEYDDVMSKLGLEKILETYPPFTNEYLEKYEVDIPTQQSEYLILGYKKK